MKATVSGFSTIDIEIKNHDGYKNAEKPYVWLTQHDQHDESASIIIIPLEVWGALSFEVSELRAAAE